MPTRVRNVDLMTAASVTFAAVTAMSNWSSQVSHLLPSELMSRLT